MASVASMTTVHDPGAVPIIDLGALHGDETRRDELAERLCAVCHEVGFALLSNHGIAPELVDDVFSLMERFFALDESQRALIDKTRSPHFRGWEAVGSEYTNNRVDVREQIDVWSEWPVETDADAPVAARLLGPNQWLSDDVLAGQREVTLRWMDELGRLADRLLSLMARGLGLPDDHFAEMFGDGAMSLTKMISYPPTPDGGAGVNAHHDAGFLTLLAPGTVPGLQILDADDEWVDVPIVEGTLVMNLGEMLQAMTANYFVATPHRVITNEARLSTAYFHGPRLDTEVAVLPLPSRFAEAVEASPRHRSAGFMASAEETGGGVGDMASSHRPSTYGEQLWNYFVRSYPDNVRRHHPDVLVAADPG